MWAVCFISFDAKEAIGVTTFFGKKMTIATCQESQMVASAE
jgi:hypothetical protein